MNEPTMIPRIIHYCWFGGNPMNEQVLRCIESWKKLCPNYEIIKWDESNFDVSYCDYTREAYDAKKWAFVSDVARLHALKEYGGIYMDTDVELLRPLDDLLSSGGVMGFENENTLQTAFMAFRKSHWLLEKLLTDYKVLHFIREDGSLDQKPNVVRLTEKCLEYGLILNGKSQVVDDILIFPQEYFSPKDYKTGVLSVAPHTYAIHHFDASWYTKKQIAWLSFERKIRQSSRPELADSVAFRGMKKLYIYGATSVYQAIKKRLLK